MFRSALAVLAGLAVLTIGSFAIELAVNPLLLRAFPAALAANLWVKGLTIAYSLACIGAGGYMTAVIAKRSPIQHAAVLGVLQAALTVVAMISPEAYHASRLQWILTAIVSIRAALAGAAVYSHRNAHTGSTEVARSAGP